MSGARENPRGMRTTPPATMRNPGRDRGPSSVRTSLPRTRNLYSALPTAYEDTQSDTAKKIGSATHRSALTRRRAPASGPAARPPITRGRTRSGQVAGHDDGGGTIAHDWPAYRTAWHPAGWPRTRSVADHADPRSPHRPTAPPAPPP